MHNLTFATPDLYLIATAVVAVLGKHKADTDGENIGLFSGVSLIGKTRSFNRVINHGREKESKEVGK